MTKEELVQCFMDENLTKEAAIAIHDSRDWEMLSLHELAVLQLHQKKLCIPFDKFHEAIEFALARPVFTHEFAYSDRLKAELGGLTPSQGLQDILSLIPAEKRLLIEMKDADNDR